jgi:hypothetical protein
MARELPPGPQRRFLEADAAATRRLPPPGWPF